MSVLKSAPETLDWHVYANSLNEDIFRFVHGGYPWPLTGANVYATARRTRNDPDVAMTATVTVIDALQGEFQVRWPGDEIADLLDGEDEFVGVWDLKVLPVGYAEPVPILTGEWFARMDVGR